MFKVQKEPLGKFTKLKLLNTKTGEFIAIIPQFGANINELVLNKNGKSFSVIKGDENYENLIKNRWFKGAKLIPFPNRINGGVYLFHRRKYHLPVNFPAQNHAIHGLIYNKVFDIEKISERKESVKVVLKYVYDKEITGYPFCFEVKIHYALTPKGFECSTVIRNISKEKLPVGDGWHPYFTTGNKIDNLWLKLPSKRRIKVNKRMIPTGEKVLFDKFSVLTKIKNCKLDTGFVLPKEEGIASTKLYDEKKNITIIVWQQTGKMKYNYLQVFIPPLRNSIAIEPMTCNTDAFNNKEGLIILEPDQQFKASYGVSNK